MLKNVFYCDKIYCRKIVYQNINFGGENIETTYSYG